MAAASWTFDENEITAAAKQLGIKLTHAELGTELARHGPLESFGQRSTMTMATWTSASSPLKTPTPTRFEGGENHYGNQDQRGCQ